jgi:hypothetical protein
MVEAKVETEWFFPSGGCQERDERRYICQSITMENVLII